MKGGNYIVAGLGNRGGYGNVVHPSAFNETIQEIRVFLKVLSGERRTNEENDIMESVTMQDYFHFFELEAYINRYIEWLTNILPQCRRTQTGIQISQDLILQNRYEPGGTLFQEAQRRNVDMYGIGQ